MDVVDQVVSYVAVAFFAAVFSFMGGTCYGRNDVCERICRSRGFEDGELGYTNADDPIACDCWMVTSETVPVP